MTNAATIPFDLSGSFFMASQRILLLTIGGVLADALWEDICGWSDDRQSKADDAWSSDDWPADTQHKIDAFVDKIAASCYTPPILYRSEHVDCWSMGDTYAMALVKRHPDYSRRLFGANHEIIATWVRFTERIAPDRDVPAETEWLYARIDEAIGAWGEFAEDRLLILVRSVLGALWTDEEVVAALGSIPTWWTKTEQSRTTEPTAGPASNGESSPPAR